MANIYTILFILLGYIIGSIPWALVIGKTFYNTDVRNHGSGNLGGTNVLRTLGFIPGVSVMILDGLKALMYMTILHFIGQDNSMPYAGLAVCIGHCYPVFANFKGGKAVASSAGFAFAITLFLENKFLVAWLLPMIIFLTVLLIDGRMSLASITMQTLFTLSAWLTYSNKMNAILVTLLAIYVIYKHKANIKRIINGTESSLKKKK